MNFNTVEEKATIVASQVLKAKMAKKSESSALLLKKS